MDPSFHQTDRRSHPRLNTNIPVTLRYNGRLIPATAIDMSCGGMCLMVNRQDMSEEGKLEIVFDLTEEDKDVTVRGHIVRVQPGHHHQRLGVQFTNVSSTGHSAIFNFVSRHLH